MSKHKWSSADIPPLNGRTAVVTGTGGIGLEVALELARAGGDVIVAGRNPAKGEEALSRVRVEVPSAAIRFEKLDLADLSSVADFASRLKKQQDRLDILVNNAGVMVPPERKVTADGFELQFGTNYLGHFALTSHLMPLLRHGKSSRVVSLSSIAAREGDINFDDLQAERSYKPMPVYRQSKLACLMFAFELHRRSVEGGWGVSSIAAHPGVSRTELLHNASGRWSGVGLARTLLWFMFQPASQGALPPLFAATSPDAKSGAYYGPDKLNETRGHPALSKIPPNANDLHKAEKLWQVSEQLTGQTFC